MIYNYIKCESVIAKIMADLDSTEARQRTTDIREWIFEAVEKIGAPMQYIHKESGSNGVPILKIQDHQVPLPDDLQHLDGVAYRKEDRGRWIPMRTNTAIFKEPKPNKRHPNDEHQPMRAKAFTTQYQVVKNQYSRHLNNVIIDEDPQYFIKPGWLVTNKRDGYIKLAYKAIATDERGYPLIPDLASYQEAVYWYVVMKLSFSKWMKGKLGGKGVNAGYNMYAYIQQQWNFYRNQAYAEAMMPTADDMQNIKNEWNRLIPEIDEDDTFFRHQGDDQQFYSDYYYGY